MWNIVPHIDLEENNKEIYNKALDDVFKALLDKTTPTGKYIDSAIVVEVLKQLQKGKE